MEFRSRDGRESGDNHDDARPACGGHLSTFRQSGRRIDVRHALLLVIERKAPDTGAVYDATCAECSG